MYVEIVRYSFAEDEPVSSRAMIHGIVVCFWLVLRVTRYV